MPTLIYRSFNGRISPVLVILVQNVTKEARPTRDVASFDVPEAEAALITSGEFSLAELIVHYPLPIAKD